MSALPRISIITVFLTVLLERRQPCFTASLKLKYIIQLLNARQHPEQTYRSCQGVLSFSARAGKERLNNACHRALQYGDYSYQTIRVILEKGLDRNVDDQQDIDLSMPPHLNIRGKHYYQY